MEKILILMSTYNGEKYLRDQLNSILAQKNVLVQILVRDDGSSDNTLQILKEYKEKGKLGFYTGNNLKPARSFMDLLFKAPDADYYALCDQDDVWDNEKLISAVESLQGVAKPALYYHAMNIVDEKLNKIGYYFREEKHAKSLKYSTLFGDEISGCTMVFNQKLLHEVRKYNPTYITMHDGWLHRVCLSVGGVVLGDERPYVFYRQHCNNVVGMHKRNLKEKIKQLGKHERSFSRLATEMIYGYGNLMTEENREFLIKLSNYGTLKINAYLLKVAVSVCKDTDKLIKFCIKLWLHFL